MVKEAHSHGTYQDFIRGVGSRKILLPDNAQILVGKKLTKTSHDHATKQIAIAPHNQNQNQAERKIHDIKNSIFACFSSHQGSDCLLVLLYAMGS